MYLGKLSKQVVCMVKFCQFNSNPKFAHFSIMLQFFSFLRRNLLTQVVHKAHLLLAFKLSSSLVLSKSLLIFVHHKGIFSVCGLVI
ncbi:hypothetical protein QVD17_02068 [Tagetes erecta]|uniref:Uncharacterized protein n=1 Tax=Tagetes erecta TaxID=13708 RepID=A0AAD8L5X5_TARER|nr:hypothetical protein QVD17_02068 [Tagetes erecta]